MNKSAALFISVILLTQIASYSFNEIQSDFEQDSSLQDDSNWEVSGRNNTTGNNTSGNNTGGNNTGGNNTGGNNTSGNNTGGNNTGGNNTGGNNTGGNNTFNDAHCLILTNFTISQTYYVSIYLENTCATSFNYPGINATANNSGVSGIYDTWWYGIGGNNTGGNNTGGNNTTGYSYYQMGWQLSFNPSIQNGTMITLDFEATVMNCGSNNPWSHQCPNSNESSFSYQFQYVKPPISLVISSATINSENNSITLSYYSQNYTGYISWSYPSLNGYSNHSSYSNSGPRTTEIYPDVFGTIQICGTIGNTVTECVSVNRVARLVEGHLITPSNNSLYYSSYVFIEFTANNYSTGYITLNSQNYNYLDTDLDDYNNTNSTSIFGNSTMYIPYGFSSICLELTGEDGTQLSDCITVERYVPPHSVSITYPTTGVSFTGQYLSLSYTLENSSSHHFTVDGASVYANSSNSSMVQIDVGFGTHEVCVVSNDFANQMASDCVTVNMIDPNADSDSDGVIDTSDLCPNTPATESVNNNGCGSSQLDSDSDGVTDNLDTCPSTQMGSSVDTNGCAAYQRDTDGDGVMDNLDTCPSTPANSVVDAYGCANSQTDADNDGVMDNLDLCPNTFVGSQVDTDGCAPSQLDSDSDGVVDSFDQCPGTASGTVVDLTGCAPSTSGNNNGSSSGNNTSDDSDSGGLPSIGIVGTLAAIGLSFVAVIRREQEE